MNESARRIFSGNRTSRSELAELVQWLFVAELLTPSEQVWFMAPRIDNTQIFDNFGGTFDALDPSWGHRKVRLLDLVLRMAGAGTRVFVVNQASDTASPFFVELSAAVDDHGLDHVVQVQTRPWLCSPGILTGHGLLRGTLELGVDMIRMVDEVVTFETNVDELAAARNVLEVDLAEGLRDG